MYRASVFRMLRQLRDSIGPLRDPVLPRLREYCPMCGELIVDIQPARQNLTTEVYADVIRAHITLGCPCTQHAFLFQIGANHE